MRKCSRYSKLCLAAVISTFAVKESHTESTAGIHDADIVIIGGGIVGASLALHLSSRPHDLPLSIIVLDKGFVGSGASGNEAFNFWRSSFSSELSRFECWNSL